METEIKVTIFTPTYNRKNELIRLYESLKKQTVYTFEWLIIDDGSSDDTERVVSEFIDQALFSIKYIYKTNGGKHTAYNLGLEKASGEIFVCVDSDDVLLNDGVEKTISCQEEIRMYGGMIAYKVDFSGNLFGSKLPDGLESIKFSDLQIKYGCKGEYYLAFDTEAARKYPFPIFENEKFVTEGVVYDKFNRDYQFYVFREPLMQVEYRADGYTMNINRIMKDNPCGFCLFYMQRIDLQVDMYNRMIIAGKYQCFKLFARKKAFEYKGPHRVTVVLAYLLGRLFCVYYKLFRGF